MFSNRRELQAAVSAGKKVRYLFFWGTLQGQTSGNTVNKGCLSQWSSHAFDVDGVHYKTAEHYMMAFKARLFGDERRLTQILHAKHPAQAKKLGRMVKNFDQSVWEARRVQGVVQGNLAKFSQEEALLRFLLGTKNRVLVEASPKDRIWGIGLAESDPKASVVSHWKGENLLGFALMEAREQLRAEVNQPL